MSILLLANNDSVPLAALSLTPCRFLFYLYLLSLISYLLSFIFYLLSLISFLRSLRPIASSLCVFLHSLTLLPLRFLFVCVFVLRFFYPSFFCHRPSSPPHHLVHLRARHFVEDRLCFSRESVVSSQAWASAYRVRDGRREKAGGRRRMNVLSIMRGHLGTERNEITLHSHIRGREDDLSRISHRQTD